MNLTIDVTEFNEARWWSPASVHAADPKSFDPHYLRLVEKVSQQPNPQQQQPRSDSTTARGCPVRPAR